MRGRGTLWEAIGELKEKVSNNVEEGDNLRWKMIISDPK